MSRRLFRLLGSRTSCCCTVRYQLSASCSAACAVVSRQRPAHYAPPRAPPTSRSGRRSDWATRCPERSSAKPLPVGAAASGQPRLRGRACAISMHTPSASRCMHQRGRNMRACAEREGRAGRGSRGSRTSCCCGTAGAACAGVTVTLLPAGALRTTPHLARHPPVVQAGVATGPHAASGQPRLRRRACAISRRPPLRGAGHLRQQRAGARLARGQGRAREPRLTHVVLLSHQTRLCACAVCHRRWCRMRRGHSPAGPAHHAPPRTPHSPPGGAAQSLCWLRQRTRWGMRGAQSPRVTVNSDWWLGRW